MKQNNKELISMLLSKSKEIPFKPKAPRSHRSIDTFRKQSLSKKRTSKYEYSIENRYSPNNLSDLNKKILKYKQSSGKISGKHSKNSSCTVNTDFRAHNITGKGQSSPLSTTAHNVSTKAKSPLSYVKFTSLNQIKRLGKTHLYKHRNDGLKGIDTSPGGLLHTQKEPLSITTPKLSNDLTGSTKLRTYNVQNDENTSKSSSKNSPAVLKSSVSNYEVTMFNTNSDTDSIGRSKEKGSRLSKGKYGLLKKAERSSNEHITIRDNSPPNVYSPNLRRLWENNPTQESIPPKTSLYQGGLVAETEEGKIVEQEDSKDTESEEILVDLSERGNKAVSDNGSLNENNSDTMQSNDIKEEVEYEEYVTVDHYREDEDSPPTSHANLPKVKPDKLLNKQISPTLQNLKEKYSKEEEKVFYRGRGLKEELKNPEIPTEYCTEKGVDITPDMFQIESPLGRGAFGKVFLVTKKDSNMQYAMKVLSKAEICKNNITRYAVTEKNVMSRISHPFIVGLNYAFQTNDLLYLILDY